MRANAVSGPITGIGWATAQLRLARPDSGGQIASAGDGSAARMRDDVEQMTVRSALRRTPGLRHLPERDDEIASFLQPTVADLIDRVGATHSPRQIELAATRAMRELRGSIHLEALPDMVSRLVLDRLTRQRSRAVVDSRRSAPLPLPRTGRHRPLLQVGTLAPTGPVVQAR